MEDAWLEAAEGVSMSESLQGVLLFPSRVIV
jgi:hypothetical protein